MTVLLPELMPEGFPDYDGLHLPRVKGIIPDFQIQRIILDGQHLGDQRWNQSQHHHQGEQDAEKSVQIISTKSLSGQIPMPSLTGIFYIYDYLSISLAEFFDTSSDNPARLKELTGYLKLLDDSQLENVTVIVKGLVRK